MHISSAAIAFAAACALLVPAAAFAYIAVGDRVFPATILLPQAAPGDAVYVTPSTRPVPGGDFTNLTTTLDKTITERFGIGIQDGYNWIGRTDASTLVGWQNLITSVKYEAILDPPREFLFTIGATHEFAGTGTHRVGAASDGATRVPTVYCAKGLGDLPIGYLRPLALQGFTTYELSSGSSRPDNFIAGLAVEYSIPYLQSKVKAFDLPDLLRGMTPLVETLIVTPTGNRGSTTTSAVVAPGIAYAGEAGNSRSRREYRQATPPVLGSASSLSSTCRSITSFQTASVNRYSPLDEALDAARRAGLAQITSAMAKRWPDTINWRCSGFR
jgi:hypothetical protein